MAGKLGLMFQILMHEEVDFQRCYFNTFSTVNWCGPVLSFNESAGRKAAACVSEVLIFSLFLVGSF